MAFHREEAPNDSGVAKAGVFSRFVAVAEIHKYKTQDMQSLVGFSVIPKRMTLKDLEQLFHAKFWFASRCEISRLDAVACLLSYNCYIR